MSHDGPGIGPSLEWRREQRGEVIAEWPLWARPGPAVARHTISAWILLLQRTIGRAPRLHSSQPGPGRVLPGRRDWRDPGEGVADPGEPYWHAYQRLPDGRDYDDLTPLERLRLEGWSV